MSLQRRQFLQQSIALASVAAIPCVARSAVRSPAGMRMGLVTYLWGKDMNLDELLKACEFSGLLGVELRTEHKHAVEPSLSAAERSEIKKRFADSPVELVGYGSNCEYHSDNPAEVKKNIEQTKKYIQLMHDCGGTGVKVKPNGIPKGLTREKTIEQIGKALNEVAAYGEGYGQQIRVEVHGKTTSELPVMRDIFKIATHSNAAICWNSNGEDLIGDGLEANFNMVKDRFGATVHVRELDDKGYPYAKLIKLFSEINFEGWILLEARTDPADKAAAMKAQKEIFDRYCKEVS
jgi:Xylose isomerase-like TIM barrel